MPKKNLLPHQRLIVAADFDPKKVGGASGVRREVLGLAGELKNLGVIIKIETSLRACGYELISQIHDFGLEVFADAKLSGIPQTLGHDGQLLRPYKPELVTTMCTTGVLSMRALKDALPDTEVLGVTFLTHLDGKDAQNMFGCSEDAGDAVLHFASFGMQARLDGFICAPADLEGLREPAEGMYTLNTPGVRPEYLPVSGDDQNALRTMTVPGAFKNGADRVVIGRPVIQAANKREATSRIIEEIAKATG